MFSPNSLVIEKFVGHTVAQFRRAFPGAGAHYEQALKHTSLTALESLLSCDCPYHDITHTILVADVGHAILQGRQLARGDLTPHDWLQAVVAMMFHDIGYIRTLLRKDGESDCVINPQGQRVTPPRGATDAFMTPYHVTRGAMFIRERFSGDNSLDTDLINDCIEMTRFPVPHDLRYRPTDTPPGLVRVADLIGQMADPQYFQKLSHLFAEFVEIGAAERMGFSNAGDLHAGFPEFFYHQVHPYIGAGVAYLKRTQDGQQWIANLYHHLHVNHGSRESDPKVRAPELVIDNVKKR